MAYTSLAANECSMYSGGGRKVAYPFTTDWGSLQVANLSTKIHRMVGAKRPPDDQRLMDWSEDALDLENACRYWEKAAGLLRGKIRKAAAHRLIPAA